MLEVAQNSIAWYSMAILYKSSYKFNLTVFKKILELNPVIRLSKHDKLVNGIINSIDNDILKEGDTLPTVNAMVEELGYARKTIVKAYTDLKERGIVESRKRQGYFIINTDTQQQVKVALVLYALHTFQEEFYNTFRKSLGKNIQLDIFFHHNNMQIFESILNSIHSQYGMYVVAPIVKNKSKVRAILSKIPANKLLLVDRYLKINEDYSYVVQRFRKPMYQVLMELETTLNKYDNFILFFKKDADYPNGILKAFQQFFSERGSNASIVQRYESGTIQRRSVYFTINDNDLWRIIKDCKAENFELGKDAGIFSHNENIIKEIISGGITTFSTDFKTMAKKAAKFVKERKPMHDVIESKLIRRASL